MATTTPDSIYLPVGTDPVAPLHTVFSTLAVSVQNALNKRQRVSYVWANKAARDAQAGMTTGATGYQVDTKVEYIYNGTVWEAPMLPTYGAFTPTGVYSADSVRGARAVAQNGRVYLEGAIRSTSALFVVGTSYGAGSIPAAFAPKTAKAFAVDINRTHGYLTITPAGAITFVCSVGFTGVLDLAIDGLNWTDAKYV